MSKRYKFNTRWNGNDLKCACLYGNPCCDRFKSCEVLELAFKPYADIEECMKVRKYRREKRAFKTKMSVLKRYKTPE